MKLSEALRLEAGDVVAFVGGGGKTTAMFCLASEIVAEGGRVITTTTTRIFAAQTRLAPVHVQSLPDLLSACEHNPHVLLTGDVNPTEGKAFGVDPSLISKLAQASLIFDNQHRPNAQRCGLPTPPQRAAVRVTNILLEADGSRMRPFKAPADHEPVIPECATLVVPVVGIDALGKPLTADNVHRPELIARIYPGREVTAEMIASVLASPLGGLKNIPAGARVMVLINKVEDESELAGGRAIAACLPRGGRIAGVVLASVADRAQPVVEVIALDG